MFSLRCRYVSEFTRFMNGYLEEHPEVARSQQEGRALLWDKEPADPDERARFTASRVKQKSYVYQPD